MGIIGLDLHKRESQLPSKADDGTITDGRIVTSRERLTAVLGARPRARIPLEASTESEWVARHLESLGHEVIVADPNYAPMYANRSRRTKTDKRDARTLMDACESGAWRPAYRRSEPRLHATRGTRVVLQSAQFRRVVGAVTFQRAGFWTGTRDDVTADLTLRPLPGFNLRANWFYNSATLPEASFEAQIYRLCTSVDFTPLLSLTVNTQYVNVTRRLGTKHRLVKILTPGNTLCAVYEQNRRNPVDERFVAIDRQMNLKLVFTERM